MSVILMAAMPTAEEWIQLLKLYGPMALFVFMVVVLLSQARARSGMTNEEKKVQLGAYLFVWVSIFVLAGFIVVIYWKTNFPPEYQIVGRITNLRDPQAIVTEEPIFLHKRPVAAKDFAYDWRLISNQQFTGTVELLLQQSPGASEVLEYKLSIQKEFYDGPVEIEYDKSSRALNVSYGHGQHSVVQSSPSSVARDRNPSPDEWGVVFAASLPSTPPRELVQALDADDPLIRRAARVDLVQLGSSSAPFLSAGFENPMSSYRLRLGILATLKDIGKPSLGGLSETCKCAILKATSDPDFTMRQAAQAVVDSFGISSESCQAAASRESQTNYTVSSKVDWTNTEIHLNVGDSVTIAATGQVIWGHNKEIVGPEGSTTKLEANRPWKPYPVKRMGAGGLIDKIGSSGRPYRAGKNITFKAKIAGDLFLGINDNDFSDNSGEYAVNVKIVRAK